MTALESKVIELLNHRVTLKMAQTVIECVKAECVEAVESVALPKFQPYDLALDYAKKAIEAVK